MSSAPPLGQGFGYGIVIGLGFAFAYALGPFCRLKCTDTRVGWV